MITIASTDIVAGHLLLCRASTPMAALSTPAASAKSWRRACASATQWCHPSSSTPSRVLEQPRTEPLRLSSKWCSPILSTRDISRDTSAVPAHYTRRGATLSLPRQRSTSMECSTWKRRTEVCRRSAGWAAIGTIVPWQLRRSARISKHLPFPIFI